MSNERSPRALCSTTMGTSGTGLLSLFRGETQLAGCALDCTLRATVQLREAFSEVRTMPTDDSVMRSIVLPVPPEQAWDALTRPAELAEWLADEVESDGPLEEGSEALLRWDDGQERVAVVDAAEEPRRLVFTWRAHGTDDETRVEF